jgi:predicted transport protein
MNTNNSTLEYVKEDSFKLEKEIQHLCESSLNELLNLEFVKSECSVNQFRIDTLAYDKETNSFVIIEFKRDKSYSVIDQGYSYLSLLLNNRADFIVEYNEKHPLTPLRRDQVDWGQSRVIFIAPSFTEYQKEAINFKDLPIELWQINRYSGNIICFNQITARQTVSSIKTIQNNETNIISQVSSQITVYDEESHLVNKSQFIIELYQKIKEYILNFGNEITIRPRKYYIGFIIETTFCDITIQSNSIKIWLNNMRYGELNDPLALCRDVRSIRHNGNGDYEIRIETEDNLEYIIGLIKQSYKLSKK